MPRPVDSSDLERLGGDLRQEMSATAAGLRQEMSAMAAGLRQEMSATTVELRQEMSATTAELRQEMSATTAELRQEIHASAEETRLQMEQFQSRILARVDASAAETRRYFGVVAEDLKSDIKAVAEGLGALDEKVERFRGEVREDFGRVDRRLLHLEVRVIGRSDPS
jgi:glutamate-1-semialdehyde aminotransferase